LPSEAEWEYACRAGTTTPFNVGVTLSTNLANYGGDQTIAVGKFAPNAFGLYDMHGNVWEWCADYYHDSYQGAPTNGSAWVEGGDRKYRLLRGGSLYDIPRHCRSANRGWYALDIRIYYVGFRVCLPFREDLT
jgi:formylglycine-generating enzyme required for sulfatase activity